MALINKSLGYLYRAVSGSVRVAQAVSIGGLAGGGTNVSFSSFGFDSASVALPYTYIVEGTSENIVWSFTSAGTRFDSKVKDVNNNYAMSIFPNDGAFTYGTNAAGNDAVKASTTKLAVTTISNPPYLGGQTAYTITTTYNDGGWSQQQSGFNSTQSKTFYTVDSYNSINADVLCVDINTPILLANGSTVLAGDLYVGDVVKTYVPTDMPEWMPDNDPENWYWWYQTGSSGEVVDATISNVYYSFIETYMSINDGEIKCTKAHPLFIHDLESSTYQFVKAEDITIGDKLIKYNSTTSEMEEIDVVNIQTINETLEIATITVDAAHTFLSNGYVSHNKGSATASIPSSGLVCYLDAERTASYAAASQQVWHDLTGLATGFNMFEGSYNGPGTAPTFTNTTPKYLTFPANDTVYGAKLTANASGTGNSYFNTTTAGFTIFTFIRNIGATTPGTPTAGILRKGNDWDFFIYANQYTLIQNGTRTGGGTQNGNSSFSFDNGWQSVALVHRNTSIDIYKNGVVGTNNTSNVISSNWPTTKDMYLGQNNSTNTPGIGNLLFYNRALSTNEILTIHNNMKGRFGL